MNWLGPALACELEKKLNKDLFYFENMRKLINEVFRKTNKNPFFGFAGQKIDQRS